MPAKELTASLTDQIWSRHSANIELDKELKKILLRKLNGVRECGVLIVEAKAALTKEEFSKATKGIPLPVLRAYISSSNANSSPVTELSTGMLQMRVALQTGGLLPFFSGHDGHGQQRLHREPDFLSHISDGCAHLADHIRRALRSHPLRWWDTQQVQALAAALAPLLNISKELYSNLERRRT